MTSTQVTEFEALRPHLMAVAYRLTGTVADAEDIVQEAWLRWNSAGARDPIADLRAWLTTVVSRLGLDRLRSAAHRRETYTGNWLPEPVVTGYPGSQGSDPLAAAVARVLGTSEAAARQLATRARKAVTASPPPEPDPSHNEVVGKLMAAMADGDLDAVVALLHPDVTF